MTWPDLLCNFGASVRRTKRKGGSYFKYSYKNCVRGTQGNYATRDSNGMCHLMPQRHLPEWREEDERAFVHRGSWISNQKLDSTIPAHR